MSVRTETLQLRVVVDGSPARRELATLDQEYAKINSELRDLKKNTEAYNAATTRLGEIRTRQEELRKEIGLTGLTAKQLGDELRRLQIAQRNLTPNTQLWAENAERIEQVKNRLRELNDVNARAQAAWEVHRRGVQLTNMTMEQLEQESRRLGAALRTLDPNSAKFVQLRRELNAVDERMRVLRTGLGPFGRMWQDVKSQVMGAGAVLGAMFAGSGIISGLRGWVRGAADLSDAQADVRRTTGLTKEEVDALTRSLSNLNTRTARSELLGLAADAGKLGITGTENVLQFVRAGDQIRVALGEDLGEDAIKNIGKLNQTFEVGAATGKTLEEQMLATGSAINALGQSSTADEAFLVDFTTRMAGVNKQAGISIQSTLGYAAALDQLGQRSETSSTALSQFTLKAFKETAAYASIAGMGLEEFTALLNSDTNEALLRVLDGLQGNNEGLSRMTALFGDLGQEGARAVGVLSSLANNTKLVREQQAIANREFAAGTSITDEFNTKNNTLAANLDIIGKRLAGAFVNSAVVQGINKLAQGLRDMVSPSIADGIEEERQALVRLHSQILTTNVGSEERIRLVNELQQKYPQIIGNLNAETASNDEVARAVKAVNEQLINRIIIAQHQERIDAEIQAIAEARQQRMQAEDAVLRQLEAAARKYGVQLQAGATVLEQSQRTYVLIKEAQDKLLQGRSAGGILVNDVARLGNAINNLRVAQAQENERSEVGNQLLKDKADLMKRLGIEAETAAAATSAAVNPEPSGTGEPETPQAGDDAERTRLKEHLKQLEAELLAYRERIFQSALTADEIDLRQLDVKHAAERAKLKANALATEEDLKALEAAQARERAELIEAQGDERVRGYSEAADRIRRATLDSAALQLADEIQKWDQLIALAKKYGIDSAALEKAKGEAEAKIRKGFRDKETADAEKTDRAQLQSRIQTYQAMGQAAAGLNSFLNAIYADAQGRAFEDTEWGKALALVQIATNAAVAVSQAVSSSTAGDPYSLAARVAVAVGAVLGAIGQAYSVLRSAPATPPPPSTGSAAGSGPSSIPLGEKGLVLEGPSHADDGLTVLNPKTGRPVAELEGGELVLSKLFTRNNADLVPMLLQLSATGARLPIGRNGGVFGRVAPFNFRAASDAVQMANGGVVGQYTYTFTKGGSGLAPESGGHSGAAPAHGYGMADPEVKSLLRQLVLKPLVVSTKEIDRRKGELSYLQEQGRVRRLK